MHQDLKEKADFIEKWNEGLTRGVTLRLVRTGHPESRNMEEFVRNLAELAPGIQVEEQWGDTHSIPEIAVADRWHFHCIPTGTELNPFLELLHAVDRGTAPMSNDVRVLLESHGGNVHLVLFVSPRCPHCPEVLRLLAPLPIVHEGMRLTVIDGQLFPELASEYKVRAVPTLIGEDGMQWIGQIRLESVLETLLTRNVAPCDQKTLERMIMEGNAASLSAMMVRNKGLFPAFADVLTHELFSIRLGAMAVMEDLGEQAPELARKALDSLWERMPHVHEAVQGDIVYLIGIIGDYQWSARLDELLAGQVSRDLREAVEDALHSLASR